MISERTSVLENPWLMLASAPVLSDPDWMLIIPGLVEHFWLTRRRMQSWANASHEEIYRWRLFGISRKGCNSCLFQMWLNQKMRFPTWSSHQYPFRPLLQRHRLLQRLSFELIGSKVWIWEVVEETLLTKVESFSMCRTTVSSHSLDLWVGSKHDVRWGCHWEVGIWMILLNVWTRQVESQQGDEGDCV